METEGPQALSLSLSLSQSLSLLMSLSFFIKRVFTVAKHVHQRHIVGGI
jgi:hypothetical protein